MESLNILRAVNQCGLQIDHFNPFLRGSSASLQHVKHLSLRLTHCLNKRETTQGHSRELGDFIVSIPQVAELELHWYILRDKTQNVADKQDQSFFDQAFEKLVSMTSLRSCILRGLYMSEASLVGFLKRCSARRITLQEIHLQEGTFRSILDFLTRNDSDNAFTYFHLDDLLKETSWSTLMR